MSMISFNTTTASASHSCARSAGELSRSSAGDTPSLSRLDTLDLSAAAQDQPVRQDLVARMRAAIASGQYERDLDAKLDVVADRLAQAIDQQG